MPGKPQKRPRKPAEPYAGRWVAKIRGRVVGQGGTPQQALTAARIARSKEIPNVEYVSSGKIHLLPDIVGKVRAILPNDQPIYLVGGAVRDLLLQQPVSDLDFIVSGKAISLARKVAGALKADFYVLDEERDAGRVLVNVGEKLFTLDFLPLQGKDIDADLAARDLTINAIAMVIREPQALLDPFGGAKDLVEKQIRSCSPMSFRSDPVRILRAIRFAAKFGMRIEKETRAQMKAAVTGLPDVSQERLRDEFFKLLSAPKPSVSIRALDLLGALEVVFPEIKPLRDLEQPPPHAFHVWDHIQQVMSRLDEILDLVRGDSSPDGAKDLQSGLVAQKLGRYRQRFTKQLAEEFVRERSRWALLFFAALFHDVGKANTQSRDENGRIHFYDHEKVGAQIFIQRARALRLSNEETSLLETIVRHHGRPYMLTKAGGSPSRRAVYRFFKDTGSGGVEICLLSLADFMGKFDAQVPQDELTRHLDTLRTLLEAYFEHAEEQVSPPALVNGDDLISLLDMKPGPKMGELLEAIREAQAAGDVMDKQAAIDFARNYLAKQAG